MMNKKETFYIGNKNDMAKVSKLLKRKNNGSPGELFDRIMLSVNFKNGSIFRKYSNANLAARRGEYMNYGDPKRIQETKNKLEGKYLTVYYGDNGKVTNVSVSKNKPAAGGKRGTRRMSKKNRTQKRRHHKMRGGDSSPASVGGNPMAQMMAQSLSQGQQYERMHAQQHGGGGLDAGPFPGAVTDQSLIPGNMMAAARVAPLNAALDAIKNMGTPGMAGGRRRGKKSRKASKKSKKASKKSRKSSRKNRKTRRMRGGAAYVSSPAPFNGPSMLLSPSLEAKALSGMNAEWKLASNPDAFAPGVAKNY